MIATAFAMEDTAMVARLNPYLHFDNSARAALDFYHSIFGGNLNITTYSHGGMTQNPADAEKIMHGQLESEVLILMASDSPSTMAVTLGSAISMSLSGDDEPVLRGYWRGLAEGAQITMPLERAPWGDTFGSLTDKFGVPWMVNISDRRG